jgi:TetR/AcrR family transcriptional regulator, regulator of cefoperazone and chloramphenicol sensitivity
MRQRFLTHPARNTHNSMRAQHDEPTREKLLESAATVFAERGYYKATIREICHRAGANVAAVNYTFGDKLGLYTEVLRHCVRAPEAARFSAELDEAKSPEELIRKLIYWRLKTLCSEDRPNAAFRIMMHEFSQPTPAMSRVVDEGMRPIYQRSLAAVGKILGLPPEHETTRLCNNSIIGQVLFYAFSRPVLSRLQPELRLTPDVVERIASHIADFSIAYLQQAPRRNALPNGSEAPHARGRNGGNGLSAPVRRSRRSTREHI